MNSTSTNCCVSWHQESRQVKFLLTAQKLKLCGVCARAHAHAIKELLYSRSKAQGQNINFLGCFMFPVPHFPFQYTQRSCTEMLITLKVIVKMYNTLMLNFITFLFIFSNICLKCNNLY